MRTFKEFSKNHISYTGVVLDQQNKYLLLNHFWQYIPQGWDVTADHMTINLGSSKHPDLMGKEFVLTIKGIAQNDKVIAAAVETEAPSMNAFKHITIAVNRLAGGKPSDSKQFTEFTPIPNFSVIGVVQED